MLQPIGVFAIAPVFWASRGLHIGCAPRLGADRTKKGCSVRGARADLHIVGLEQGAALLIPVLLQTQNNLLKSEHEDLNAIKAV